ncbi:XRE family transcriptional regulator [Streptomyces sp. TM32]|uniref:helix-turn-helix transcriptional regulator n=1 Tax=Streptomyces sp. TM32 TaxID=1652669 RepID=UPI001012A727|nr:helix-turn-helix transcriptional regulator [Streptomyces sp. TM32]RXS73130.1 XRE family transcriptional regulator [Streptomyces sp. TM32]
MPLPPDRRRQLGAFLRSRRERLTPDEVGLPRTARRRTPGLRREELAFLAGISATWYTYLEQGREIRASEQVLTALAEALRLDRHERAHLLQLAGHVAAAESEAHEPLKNEVAAIPLLLQPNPAYIIGGNYDVLGHNRAADALFPRLLGNEAERPANFVRWMFLEPVARDVVVDWEPEARGLLARLRTQAGRHPADPRYTRLIDELTEGSPEARSWWRQYEVQARHSGHKRLRHPARGPVEYAYTAFHLAEQPDQTLVVYVDSSAPTTAAPAAPDS